MLIKFYGYIPIVFVLLLSYSVVMPPNLVLSFGGVTQNLLPINRYHELNLKEIITSYFSNLNCI
jgi:hypothetical protein